MPPDSKERKDTPLAKSPPSNSLSPSWGVFTIPLPLKRLFDTFPLATYPPNELPLRSPRERAKHALYIFTTEEGASIGAPSFNPSCLKWQTYLKFNGINFHTVASNNHASPTGALPFLIPATITADAAQIPIPSNRLQKWSNGHSTLVEEPSDVRYEAYLSLINHRIRRAWLYSLYLTNNFDSIAEPLYVTPTSSNPLVQLTIAHELRSAAQTELLRNCTFIDGDKQYREAEEAFSALSTVLGDNKWFFGAEHPSLFDATVFAYTHLILQSPLIGKWNDNTLKGVLKGKPNLFQHRERIYQAYYQ